VIGLGLGGLLDVVIVQFRCGGFEWMFNGLRGA